MIFQLLVLGLVASVRSDKIVGGSDVTSTSFAPWQASLQVSGSHFCGGSLISATKVMSACHCSRLSLNVILGTLQYKNPGQSFLAMSFLCHPDYDSDNTDYDYAIVTISGATLNSAVQPITVASKEYSAGTEALMTGWGLTSDEIVEKIPDNLQYAYTYLVSQSDCELTWANQITDRMQCANDDTNSACIGDSGGPLAVNDGGKWVLVGNTSWGAIGCPTNDPSVWSKNSAVYSWIQSNM